MRDRERGGREIYNERERGGRETARGGRGTVGQTARQTDRCTDDIRYAILSL